MKSILIVEDNEAIIKGLKYLLEQEQFHVIACKNIEERMNVIICNLITFCIKSSKHIVYSG